MMDRLDVLPGTCSDQSVLEPAIRTFDFPFSLRRESIDKLDPAFLKHLFPLGINIIGDEIVFPPDGVPALDETENGVAIGVIGVRRPMAQNHVFQGKDMIPASLSLDKLAVQKEPAVVVQAGDQMPLLPGIRSPFMMGGIVLDEFPDVISQHFPVVSFPFGPGDVKIMLLSFLDDRRQGDLLPVLLLEKIPDIAVVVGLDGDFRVSDQLLFLVKLLEDVLFNVRSDLSWAGCPLIGNGKLGRIFPISLDQLKEPAAPDPQDAKDMMALDFLIEIPFK
jgi:hypothetical protein